MKISALALIAGVAFSSSAFATQAVWDTATPWGSSTLSQYAEWNVFGGTSDSTPDVGLSAGTTASVTETSGASFVTSGGNIYSFALPLNITATLSGTTGGLFDVYLRIGTVGSIASTSATLNGVGATSVIQLSQSQGDFGGFGESFEQEAYWLWSNVSGASLYTFNFKGTSSSLSLDQLALATVAVAAVPEPSTSGMLGLGLGVLAFAGRRARKQNA
ncbi:PEP-CTERM sorting domain-containing protein [Methylobacillus glycogenes]|uniref:PEP-CTERM sorting domain-containing protein n=1 Tax=Methylobacillus glycogenes TaxID=406 RepID=UPI0004719029|nr:PEP-CTERM sorting domain-containing protein [Methylobacillus glycogenes]